MTHKPKQLDGVESMLLELDAVEQAGVFQRTAIDAVGLVSEPVPVNQSSRLRILLRLAPVAATVALAVGVWSLQSNDGINSTAQPGSGSGSMASASFASCGDGFLGCFTGPTDGVPADCQSHDYDSDGDVDLADFSTYQLAYASTDQTR